MGGLGGAQPDQQAEEEEYGAEEEMGDGGQGGAINLANYNLSPEVIQQIQALINNDSFPLIRQRMQQDPNFS